MRTEQRKIYISDDGQIFETEKECKDHEEQIEKRAALTTYWRVTCRPDLTEGRGWYGAIYIECYGPKYDEDTWVSDWCYRELGRPIAFAQGCSAMPNWMLRKIERKDFLAPHGQKFGDYIHEHEVKRLVVGPKERGLIEDNPESGHNPSGV